MLVGIVSASSCRGSNHNATHGFACLLLSAELQDSLEGGSDDRGGAESGTPEILFLYLNDEASSDLIKNQNIPAKALTSMSTAILGPPVS